MKEKKGKLFDKKLISRRAISLLPKHLRFKVIRNLLKVPKTLDLSFSFRIAQTKEDLEQAYRILHDSYVDAQFMKPHSSGMRILKYFLLPSTTTILVLHQEKVIGTMSIIRRTQLGLPMEKDFDLSEYLQNGAPCAEISSLAIDKNFVGNKGAVFLPICKFFNEFITQYMGINKVFIAVNPSMADFYECFLLFQKIKNKTIGHYQFANGAPAVGFYYDLSLARSEYQTIYGKREPEKNLHKYFFENKLPHFVFPNRLFNKSMDPIMSADMLRYFFIQKSDVIQSLTPEERAYLTNLYPPSIIQTLSFESSEQQKDLRDLRYFSAGNCTVKTIGRLFNDCQILDVSLYGLKIASPLVHDLQSNTKVHVFFPISPNQQVKLVGTIQWTENQHAEVGIKLQSSIPDLWKDYIGYIQNDFSKLEPTTVLNQTITSNSSQ